MSDQAAQSGMEGQWQDLRGSYTAPSRQIAMQSPAGQWMQSRQPTDLMLQALLMAVWRRKPTRKVLVHSDQGSQFTSIDWRQRKVPSPHCGWAYNCHGKNKSNHWRRAPLHDGKRHPGIPSTIYDLANNGSRIRPTSAQVTYGSFSGGRDTLCAQW